MASPPRSTAASSTADPDRMVAEIELVRDRLAQTVDAIVERTNPKNVARRTAIDVRARFVNPDGSPRLETITPVAIGALGFLVLVSVIRKIVR